jgi:replicative superfamily II helicase
MRLSIDFDYLFQIVFLHESDMDRKIKFENEVKLNSELLNHVQTMVASYVSNGVNVVFAAPSSAGKTFVTM